MTRFWKINQVRSLSVSDCETALLHITKTLLIQCPSLTYCMADNPTCSSKKIYKTIQGIRNKICLLSNFSNQKDQKATRVWSMRMWAWKRLPLKYWTSVVKAEASSSVETCSIPATEMKRQFKECLVCALLHFYFYNIFSYVDAMF